MTVYVLQKTEDLVKKRSVRKIVSVEERLKPFGQISILNEQSSVLKQTVQNENTSTEIQSVTDTTSTFSQ